MINKRIMIFLAYGNWLLATIGDDASAKKLFGD
jgi:hypothetical protein